jgi:hypothetical protein
MVNRPTSCLSALFVGICLLLSGAACSQATDSVLDGVVHTWKRYAERHRPPGLFLHLDKSVYEHTEHIQFTAWLLDGQRDTSHLHSLYVLLVDPALRKLVAFDRFVLSRYAAVGALYLADTLHPGKYLVVAYTDDRLQGFDQPAFRQEITLLPDLPPPFSLVLQRDTARLKFRVPTDYGGLAAGGNFRYRLQVDGRTIDSGEKKIDAFGEVTLPQPAAAPGQLLLTAMVKRQDQTAYFWQPIVTAPVEWRVRYYPEGGDLVADRPSQIGIEIRDGSGSPIPVLGRLLEDGQPVVAFKTDSNGLGLLVKEFKSGRRYTVDFPDKPAGVLISGALPTVQPEGYSLTVPDGVARDSIEVLLYLPAPGMKCRLLIYNEREVVYASTLLARKEAARMTIPVKDWPTGLLTMTLFDSRGLPVAERRLYCPSPDLSVTIRPDSAVYHPRSKIHLLIHAADEKGQGMTAAFSLSTVLSSRLKPDQDPDIRRYAAIDQHLIAGPVSGSDPGYGMPTVNWEDHSTINLLLLTRGWTRYHWQELAADSLPSPAGETRGDYGYVLYKGKKPGTPVTMLVMGGSMLPFNTDSAGDFHIPAATLVSAGSSDLALSLSGGDKEDEYRIVLLNKYDSTNRSIAGAWYFPFPIAEKMSTEQETVDPVFAHAKTLQKVTVTPGGKSLAGCRDYVCMMGILNCQNHLYGRKPVIGETVLVADGFNQFRRVVYSGCELTEGVFPPYVRRVKPIRLLKDSYVNDTTPIPPSATALYTTLHWAPMVVTDSAGNAEVSFYANDLPGLYFNVLQGISTQGVISSRSSFTIEKDNE